MSSSGYVRLGTALAALLACAGCSHPAPAALRGAPEAVVRAAADRTLRMGSAHVDISVAADLFGRGTVDWAGRAASFSFARTGPQAHVGDHFDVIVHGPEEWLHVSGGTAGSPVTDRPWAMGLPRVVADRSHTRVNPLDTILVRPGLGTDVALLRGATKVRSYGGEEVQGVNAYRYTFEVDLAAAIAASPPAEQPVLLAASAAIGPVLWPADVWLDANGRVRRLQMAENPYAHTTTTRANLLFGQDGNYVALTNIQFYDFGTPATISTPTADQVASF
ncbi:MAG: hypothetical protein ACYDH6_15245 [Acidimicrobiales bacterium]